jgi:hypothetical protein
MKKTLPSLAIRLLAAKKGTILNVSQDVYTVQYTIKELLL